jgi:hypothetical protein
VPVLAAAGLTGRLLLAALASPGVVRTTLALIRVLPRVATRWLVRRAGAGEHWRWAVDALELDQALACAVMAGLEHREIATCPDTSCLLVQPFVADPDRLVAMLADRDRWSVASWPLRLPPTRADESPSCCTRIRPRRRRRDRRHPTSVERGSAPRLRLAPDPHFPWDQVWSQAGPKASKPRRSSVPSFVNPSVVQ